MENLVQLPAWQAGGAEEFTTGTVVMNGTSFGPFSAYWQSTGASCENTGSTTTAAHMRPFAGIVVFGYPKTDQFFVRAIRRVAV